MPRIRKNIMIDKALDLSVKETASRYDVSESSVIEKALVNYLAEGEMKKLSGFFDYAGAFDCEHRSLSKAHRKIVTGGK